MDKQPEIHRKSRSEKVEERREAVKALRYNFAILPDKKQAWEDLHRLTSDNDWDVRRHAVNALGSVFPHVPDKKQAWEELHQLTQDNDRYVRWGAADALCSAFPLVEDKKQAWKDLIRLTQDNDSDVRGYAADALGSVFPLVEDKKQAWEDLIRLTQDDNSYVRRGAASALGSVYSHIPDEHKQQAWEDLHKLTQDKNDYVRWGAADALGAAYPHIPDEHKQQACDDLIKLTQDDDRGVRIAANHSAGRVSIYRATETESNEEFREEFEKALQFFEKASNEATYFNPSRFCLPFYRSYYAIISEKRQAQADVDTYLAEAKSAVSGSESREKLLEAIENLSNALKEVQNARTLDEKKCDLNAYRKYCEKTAELLESVGDKAPGAKRVVERGLPIINERIKRIIGEIREKAKAIDILVKGTGTPYEPLGAEIKKWAGELSEKDELQTEKSVFRMAHAIKERCKILPQEKRKDICDIIREINEAKELGYNLSKLELGLTHFLSNIESEIREMTEKNIAKDKEIDTIIKKLDLLATIPDIFCSRYQKEVKAGTSDAESKTLEFLRTKLHDLNTKGDEIFWLDVGCGEGRCLDVLEKIKIRKSIKYYGIDTSSEHLNKAEQRANKYSVDAIFKEHDAAKTKFDPIYDLTSSVLVLHEVDPLCLPYVLRNMLLSLKKNGRLVISDFQEPYEREKHVVVWEDEDIQYLLEEILGARTSFEIKQAEKFPEELAFYCCYAEKGEFNEAKFNEFMQRYDDFLIGKKVKSKKKREELENQIKKRVQELLNRPDIDTKNISNEEITHLASMIEYEYQIKAQKRVILAKQIDFLDDKIEQFASGTPCPGARQS